MFDLDDIAVEADRLYELVRASENAAGRLATMLDGYRDGGREAFQRMVRARSIQRQLFRILAPVERIYHENGGHEAEPPLLKIIEIVHEFYGPFDEDELDAALDALKKTYPNAIKPTVHQLFSPDAVQIPG